ncbi:MAG: hypothetical protein HC767_08070 [Akkermansiaceae bacterium]|nr:hypothetical protein [Akkermansiaceae bacterium]
MVQFATEFESRAASGDNCSNCYVIKFFPSQAALEHECAMHANEVLRALLPPLVTRRNQGEVSVGSCELPPMIVAEAGDTLEKVFAARRPDFFQAVQVCA